MDATSINRLGDTTSILDTLNGTDTLVGGLTQDQVERLVNAEVGAARAARLLSAINAGVSVGSLVALGYLVRMVAKSQRLAQAEKAEKPPATAPAAGAYAERDLEALLEQLRKSGSGPAAEAANLDS